jgi:hypothetical protein
VGTWEASSRRALKISNYLEKNQHKATKCLLVVGGDEGPSKIGLNGGVTLDFSAPLPVFEINSCCKSICFHFMQSHLHYFN